jgi:NAD(P)-dependent dehydrogenase (short-subunit alcohol dehydrogenase family)
MQSSPALDQAQACLVLPGYSALVSPILTEICSGRSVALKFSKTYPIVLLSRSASSYEEIVSEIKASGGHAFGVATDVTDSASTKAAFEAIKKEMGDAKLAAAIYNVGGGFVRKPFLELTEEEFTAGWKSNGYVSSIHCTIS